MNEPLPPRFAQHRAETVAPPFDFTPGDLWAENNPGPIATKHWKARIQELENLLKSRRTLDYEARLREAKRMEEELEDYDFDDEDDFE